MVTATVVKAASALRLSQRIHSGVFVFAVGVLVCMGHAFTQRGLLCLVSCG